MAKYANAAEYQKDRVRKAEALYKRTGIVLKDTRTNQPIYNPQETRNS